MLQRLDVCPKCEPARYPTEGELPWWRYLGALVRGLVSIEVDLVPYLELPITPVGRVRVMFSSKFIRPA